MLYTTLNAILRHPHDKHMRDALMWHLKKTEGDNDPIPLTTILGVVGIEAALFALGHTCGEAGAKVCATFAADCAERVLPIFEAVRPGDTRPRKAIESARAMVPGAIADDISNAAYDAADEISHTSPAKAAAALAAVGAIDVVRAWTVFGINGVSCSCRSELACNNARDATSTPSVEREWQATRLRELLETVA